MYNDRDIATAPADRLLARVAQLLAMGVPQVQIAQACGISEGRVSQLKDEPAVTAEVARIQSANMERFDTLNKGWDAVEELGLEQTIEYMTQVKDPEFALRAARQANQANRRGAAGNQVLDGGLRTGATINLNAAFIQILQQMNIGPQAINAEAKRVNSLSVSEVDKLLAAPVDPATVDVAAIFGASHVDVNEALGASAGRRGPQGSNSGSAR